MVSGINFAHLALVSEPWPGTPTIDSPHFPPETPAPLVCCSSGHAPFWLPPHSGGGVLHILIVGPTGAGKSALLALMAMAWTRLEGARVRWIDLDYSSFVAAHALGADYRELGNEGTPALCPLEHASASDENEFLLAFFTRLFARWQTALTAEQQEELAYSIELGASQGLRRARHLAGLVQDLPLRRILNQYTENRPWGHTLLLAPVDLTHVKAYRIAEYVVGVWRHELHGSKTRQWTVDNTSPFRFRVVSVQRTS